MQLPDNLKYTDSHEWVRQEADGTVTVGITHHAQDQLGDLVFVEKPAVGRTFKKGEECGVVESVKAAADIYAPISGEVVAANGARDAPEKINQVPTRPGCSRSSRKTARAGSAAGCRGLSESRGRGPALDIQRLHPSRAPMRHARCH